jgi:hypothetical protein
MAAVFAAQRGHVTGVVVDGEQPGVLAQDPPSVLATELVDRRQHVGARWLAHEKILTLDVVGTPLRSVPVPPVVVRHDLHRGADPVNHVKGAKVSQSVPVNLLAIFAVIGVGWGAGRTRMLGPQAAATLGAIAFGLFVPALLFRTTAQVSLAKLPVGYGRRILRPTVTVLLLVYAWHRIRRPVPPAAGHQVRHDATPSPVPTYVLKNSGPPARTTPDRKARPAGNSEGRKRSRPAPGGWPPVPGAVAGSQTPTGRRADGRR